MEYFTSDLHLGHANIIALCHRPFSTVEEMDAALIANWNRRVTDRDTVYILGDLCFRATDPVRYLTQLKGKKHLILGNHDHNWLRLIPDPSRFFVNCTPCGGCAQQGDGTPCLTCAKKPRLPWMDVVCTSRGKVTLSHFPLMEHVGKYLIHGHVHNRTDDPYFPLLSGMETALNAGVDVNGFLPVTLQELIEKKHKASV